MNDAICLTSILPVEQRDALERLLFFNINQHRVRPGIVQSIDTYGVPVINQRDGGLSVRVGAIDGVENLFAVSADGRPLGVAVFVRTVPERIVVLHLGVEPRSRAGKDANTPVLIRLMHGIRGAARSARGIEWIELVYKDRRPVRLHG